MILIGLSILAAIGLLALIIWALRRDQRRKNEESVDRNLPLPPLELSGNDGTEMASVEDILGISASSKSPPAPPTPQTQIAAAQQSDQWLASSRELLFAGQFEEALQQCQSALPQMKAFRQSCVVLRAQIRDLKKTRQPFDFAVQQIYQLAAMAELFHGKATNTKALSPSAIKQIDYAAWQSLNSPYTSLGYEHLSLLTKTDVRWLVQEWGEPDSHGFVHELHSKQWNKLRNSI